MTMPDDQLAYNAKLIEEFRADGGKSMGDRPLLLLTTLGRRSGKRRTSPMMYVKTGDRHLVITTTAPPPIRSGTGPPGRPARDRRGPRPGVHGAATPLTGEDYEREWARIKQKYPFFAEHETRAGRQIPVVALIEAS